MRNLKKNPKKRKHKTFPKWFHHNIQAVLFTAWMLIATGCSGGAPESTPTAIQPFVAPVSAPTLTPTLDRAIAPTATASRTCKNQLNFLEDLTIPDGTVLGRGETVTKRWLVENNGSCHWDERYTVRLVAGPSLGAPERQALYPARGKNEAVIQITFQAPQIPGNYITTWQAFNPQGTRFGDPFYMDIMVEDQ